MFSRQALTHTRMLSIALTSTVLISGCDTTDCSPDTGPSLEESTGPDLEENMDVARRVSLEVVFQGDHADELIAPDFVYHSGATGQDMSREATLDFWGAFPAAFPDGAIEFHNMIAQDDIVMFQYTLQGTYSVDIFHAGESALGTSVVGSGYVTRRIENGMVVEEWDLPNMPSLMGQLTAGE